MKKDTIDVIVKVTENKESGNVEFKNSTVQIPKNVINSEIFRVSVQYHINNLVGATLKTAENKLSIKLADATAKDKLDKALIENLSELLVKASALTSTWCEHCDRFNKKVAEIYGDAKSLYKELEKDGYARLFALSITRQGKIGENEIAFTASEVSQAKLFFSIRELTINRELTKEAETVHMNAIKTFMQDNFGTNEVTGLYKKTNLTKLTCNKVREFVGTSITRRAQHNAKGNGVQKDFVKPFDVALECLFLFYVLQGVDEFQNGKKVYTVSGNSESMDLSKFLKK